NYVPEKIEFWGDVDGKGKYTHKLGETANLGPDRQNIQIHEFESPAKAVKGIELRIVKYTKKGVNRAPAIGELWLVGRRR
ncbi:MAG: hypothetical protein PF961_07670, partial [Planctomycetota bacterium]|nr:hypothetical protein [Planctomycetota bacterium]